ncbi:MAG: DNA polymerase I, partial [Anaerolineales bacterium]|nr:DNA polymerase I [Anaerolineales bacterium]
VNLLQTYGTLDNIYANLEEVQTRFRNKLADGKDSAYLSQKLARIVTDAPITLDIEACLAHDFDANGVLALFQELEFRSLTNRLLEVASGEGADVFVGETIEAPKGTETILVQTEAELAKMVKALEKAKLIAFDCETTSLDKLTARLVGISLAVEPPFGYYIPVGHIENQEQAKSGQMMLFASEAKLAENQLPMDKVLTAIRPALTNPDIPKIAHNAKFDYIILQRHGLTISPIGGDTMIAEWLSDPGTKFKGLKDLALQRLGIEMTEITELIGKGRNQITFAEVPIEDAAPYAAADADMTLRLYEPLQAEVKEKAMLELQQLELDLIPILADMEQAGIGVDVPFLKEMSGELETQINEEEARIFEIAGHPFNVNSTQQLSDVLFKELNLPHERLRRTSSGHYSTASDVLEGLKPADEQGIVKSILNYREMQKLKSTYVDALPEMVNEETGRIHTSFNQTGAITGRIASSNPNLQNIPIRTEMGQQIRRGFVARPGWQFLAADYSQVELRILAHISQDEALLDAFRHDQDIHRTTAAAVYSIGLDDVTYNQRRFAKAVNFGLIYGMGPFRLARDSELTLAEAENFIKTYFERFPGINEYLEKTKELARTQGYVETLFGRRRYFPVFQVPAGRANRQAVNRAEREAVNHPIQGTAADIVKIAMVRLHEALTGNYQAKMLLQVHDELVLEVPDAEVTAVREIVVDTMSGAFELAVPLKVEASTGHNWLELKD